MAAQKDAVVNAIRAEINLATAQELITVRIFVMPSDDMSHVHDTENFRKMLCKMRSEAGDVINELGRGTFQRDFWGCSWSWLTELLSSDVFDTMHGSLLRGM